MTVTRKMTGFALVFTSGLVLGALTTSTVVAQFRTGQVVPLLKTDLSGCAGKEPKLFTLLEVRQPARYPESPRE